MPEADRVLSIVGFSDPVSSLTHLAGAVVFAVLSVVLLHRGRGDRGRMLSLCVFALSCVLMLSLSGVYHLLSPGTAGREVLKQLDHAAIFVLIAGSFTPVHASMPQRPAPRNRMACTGVKLPAISTKMAA